MKVRLLILIMAFVAAVTCQAQNVDASDLDFGTNLSTPEVPIKAVNDIRGHMRDIKRALEKHSMTVEMERDDEVIDIIIPCSELFAPNETTLKENGVEKLRLLADLLKYPTMYKILIAVYSDNTGDDEYCESLTMERANAIDDYLIRLANNDDINVIPYGMGAEDPRVENNSIANRAINRRVEIFIVPEWQMIETARSGKLKSKGN